MFTRGPLFHEGITNLGTGGGGVPQFTAKLGTGVPRLPENWGTGVHNFMGSPNLRDTGAVVILRRKCATATIIV